MKRIQLGQWVVAVTVGKDPAWGHISVGGVSVKHHQIEGLFTLYQPKEDREYTCFEESATFLPFSSWGEEIKSHVGAASHKYNLQAETR